MAEAKMTLLDWLDDLTVRFLLNLPQSELSSVPRLCFQVEEAHWFYEDFIRPLAAAAGNQLPNLPLRQFCLLLFQHCPLLSGFSDDEHIAAYEEFLAYKVRVPVRGAILLDSSMEQVLLVRGWKKGSSWSFPRGKINKDEPDLDCAIREVWEETGYDLRASGLIAKDQSAVKYIDIIMREQHMRLFVFRDVPLDTVFETQTRKEISKIQWYSLRSLPGFAKKGRQDVDSSNANKYYMVAPFLGPLKKWIAQQRRNDLLDEGAVQDPVVASLAVPDLDLTAEESEGPAEMAAVVDTRDRSEELRRMLSIGGSALTEETRSSLQTQATQADKLLAMLQGSQMRSSDLPQTRTPVVQVATQHVPPPMPHHPRQPSTSYVQGPRQYPVSHPGQHHVQPFYEPQQMQSTHNLQAQPITTQRLHQQIGHRPMNDARLVTPTMPNDTQPRAVGPQRPLHPSDATSRTHGIVQPSAQSPGAIAAGPTVPSASQLPTPSLNAQAASLLDVFKSGARPASTTAQPRAASGVTNSHQAALLGLVKQVPASTQPPLPDSTHNGNFTTASPALSDVTVKARPQPARKATLNEITRTLPKMKRPSQPSPVTQAPRDDLGIAAGAQQSSPQRPIQTNLPGLATRPSDGSMNGLHIPPQSGGGSASNVTAAPTVTILSRPAQDAGVSAGPAAVSQGIRLHNITNHAMNGNSTVPPTSSVMPSDIGARGQQERLLTLLKRPVAQGTPPSRLSSDTPPNQPSVAASKDALLGLFQPKPSQSTSIPTATSRSQPPRAPSLQPEVRPIQAAPTPIHTSQGLNLLDLFRKGSPSAETPILPFALGSPEQARHQKLPSRSRLGDAAPEQTKGRLGSVSSSGRGTPTVTTPTEAKDFLLGYLNGVVQKEGLGRK
ncbi:mRNA-decapping enzyme subunit 2 [Oleoguttula sp. CCFEE 5521]